MHIRDDENGLFHVISFYKSERNLHSKKQNQFNSHLNALNESAEGAEKITLIEFLDDEFERLIENETH